MNTRLQAINLDDFTGGLNLWRNQFNIGPNQSPDMLNMEIDPRGGFYTRKGWSRWNASDAVFLTEIPTPYTIADSDSLDLAGDFEIVVRVALDDWIAGVKQIVVDKWETGALTGYQLVVDATTGYLSIKMGAGVGRQSVSTAAPPGVDGEALWLKVTLDADDGGGNRVANFYYAADQSDEPTSWTQIGATATDAPATTIGANTQDLVIGEDFAGTRPAAGTYYRTTIRDGIAGSAVVDVGVADWKPRNAFVHTLSTGAYVVYVANDSLIEAAPSSGVFATLAITGPTNIVPTASPHLADFAAWGDYLYIACGQATATYLRNGTGTPTAVADAATNYNDDYTTPDAIGAGAMPRCEFIETHSGYVFAAYIKDQPDPLNPTTPAVQPNRIRWSHPSQPENWAALDYIDIDAGGGKITGLRSFQDHLLIFKEDSVWALYGYDSDSWQLVRISATSGAPNTTAITASERAVYFYSGASLGGIYAYSGGEPPVYIGQSLRTVTDAITEDDDVWLGWVGKRLWCSLPWIEDNWVSGLSTVFIFDPEVGNGAWIMHRPALGNVSCIVEGSDLQVGNALVAVNGDSGAAALVEVEARDAATDVILENLTASSFDCYYRTAWQHAGWPERRKSWRRPRFILERVSETVGIDLATFFDYNEGSEQRSHTITVNADGTAFWRATGALEDGGFDWGDGTTLWGAAGASGSVIERGVQASATLSGLGVNRAIQLRFSTNPNYLGKAWGVNAMTLKFLLRRFTT